MEKKKEKKCKVFSACLPGPLFASRVWTGVYVGGTLFAMFGDYAAADRLRVRLESVYVKVGIKYGTYEELLKNEEIF